MAIHLQCFTRRFLVTDVNNGYSSASVLKSRTELTANCQLNYSAISSQPPLQSSTELVDQIIFFITPRREPRRQHHVFPIVCVTVTAGTCLLSRFPETGLI
jgi:hypothetical protein